MALQSNGRPVKVKTNSFTIRQLPNRPFYHYDVILRLGIDGAVVGPVEDNVSYREIMDKLFTKHPSHFHPRPSYDGMKSMYSSRQISQGEFDVCMAKDENSNRGRYTIQVTPVGVVQPSDFARLITSDGAQKTPANAVAVNILQLLVSQAPNLQHSFALHTKSFFVDINRVTKTLPSGLQAWRGFFQSVRPVLGKVIINIDTTTGAVYRAGSLLDSAMAYLRCKDVRELVEKCNNPGNWQRLRNFYKKVLVVTYPKYSKKRDIKELVKQAGRVEFPKDDSMVTVVDHFAQHHHLPLKFPDVFGVRLGKSNVYPAELVNIVPGQVYKQKLDASDTQEFMSISVTKPKNRIEEIAKAVSGNHLDYRNSQWMQEAGMSVDPTPLEITGRELDPPKIVYAGRETSIPHGSGAWNVMNQKLHTPAKISAWAVVCFDTAQKGSEVTSFAQKLYQNMYKLGLVFGIDAPRITLGSPDDVEGTLSGVLKAIQSHASKPRLGLVLVILPRDAGPLRKQVKQWGDMKAEVPTQCVRGGKWQTANDQYCNNVALKINAKCGGINSTIRSPAGGFIKDAMIVGCDVSHPSPGVKNRPSIASVVASIDPDATRYHAYVRLQNPRQEIIQDLPEMIKVALNDYYQRRKAWPKHLVVYRDGISEGEYSQIEEQEVQEIENILDDLKRHTQHRPSLLFVVVGKRHHVRFFPIDSNSDRSGNCRPGLVVDKEIVHSTYTDFYLQSHSGILGTSRPSHYVVLKNSVPLTGDQIQQLSYALCHVYASATRAVSIPAPVYYADRLCARADFQFRPNSGLSFDETASNVGDEFDLNVWRSALGQAKLSDKMYFL